MVSSFFNVAVHIFARNPPSILLALGGVGVLLGLSGAGWLLAFGMFLQFGWLFFRFAL